jgi:hypothetical protein
MSDLFYQDDDDLFSYDPSKEVSKPTDFSSSTLNQKDQNNEIYSHISKNINDNDDVALDGIDGLRIKFSQAVLGSYDFWLASASPVAYTNTLNSIMDQITGGRFSDLYLYNYLEINIIRRMHISHIMNDAFSAEGLKDTDNFKSFMKRIGVDIADSYVPVYIGTMIRITNHIIAQERSMYLALAEKMQITPNPTVLDADYHYDTIIKNAKSSVQQSQRDLLDLKFAHNSDHVFFDKLNNMNNTQVNHVIRTI